MTVVEPHVEKMTESELLAFAVSSRSRSARKEVARRALAGNAMMRETWDALKAELERESR